uniref:Uncharacterized protein n=1 Tax=Ditylenchus dipsaci TaxID=166011 RepID=A0A915CY93_9BILA
MPPPQQQCCCCTCQPSGFQKRHLRRRKRQTPPTFPNFKSNHFSPKFTFETEEQPRTDGYSPKHIYITDPEEIQSPQQQQQPCACSCACPKPTTPSPTDFWQVPHEKSLPPPSFVTNNKVNEAKFDAKPVVNGNLKSLSELFSINVSPKRHWIQK